MSSVVGRAGARPVAPYMGGKRSLALRLIERIDATPHELYAEPFLGMGGVFLRRHQRARFEVVNDISRDVATLFRVLQRHYVAFVEMLRWQLTTRAEFERLVATAPETLTDLERAARFVYLQRTAYGGKVSGRNFGVTPLSPARFNVTKIVPLLEAAHERLAGVVIECLPYADFIARYDRPSVLFYLDPPYWGSEDAYGKNRFAPEDFEKLAEMLEHIGGRFILSLNDCAEIRRIFRAFEIEAVRATYGIAGGQTQGMREVIITGGRARSAKRPRPSARS